MTTFVDITQLVHWPGRLTGIPRVMDELSRRFAEQDDTEFIVWSPQQQTYHLVDKHKSLEDRAKQIHYIRDPNANVIPSLEKASSFTYKVLNRLDSYDLPITPLKKFVGKGVVQAIQPTFSTGDTLFVLWGEQHSQEFIDFLKQTVGAGVNLAQISYDMLPLVTPQYSGHSTEAMQTYTREIFPLCGIVYVISESAKDDLGQWMDQQGIEKPTIEVFRLGDDFAANGDQKPSDEQFEKSGLTGGDYILCVGTVEARKNHTLLYYTYKLAKSKGVELPKIVVAGRKGWRTENIIDLINNDPETKDMFVMLHDVSDEELNWLYKNSMFGVLASFYEGWGLQIAESIYHGRPFIASKTSSTPEIAGDMIDYFNPTSTDECLRAIKKYLDPANLREAEKKIKKYTITTWDDTFKQVNKGLEDLS